MSAVSIIGEPPQPLSRPRGRVLVVDDAVEIVDLVSGLLRDEGFDVRAASDGETAVAVARSFAPDVIILDVGLPGFDGVETCQQLRRFSTAYIVMLTARADEIDKVVGLSAGADDYVTKPFGARELIARVRALLRRPRVDSVPSQRVFGTLVIDTATRDVTVAGRPVKLTRIEFDLLDALSAEPRVVLTRSQLLQRVWGPNWVGDAHVVDVHMSNLRRKLEHGPDDGPFLATVRGVGYRLAGP